MFCLAVNIVILTTTKIDLQAMLNIINTTFKNYKLKINVAKTKTNLLQEKYTIHNTLEN